MSNPSGSFVALQDPSGIAVDSTNNRVTCVAIKTALVGTLTVTGISNLDGSASSWVIASTTVGWVNPTGNSGGLANRISFSYSNAADYGKAILVYTPL